MKLVMVGGSHVDRVTLGEHDVPFSVRVGVTREEDSVVGEALDDPTTNPSIRALGALDVVTWDSLSYKQLTTQSLRKAILFALNPSLSFHHPSSKHPAAEDKTLSTYVVDTSQQVPTRLQHQRSAAINNLATSSAHGEVGRSSVEFRPLESEGSNNSSDEVSVPPPTYVKLSIHAQFILQADDGSTQQVDRTFNASSLIYYSPSNCDEGTFPDGSGGCRSCPAGCTCPGGGRCWPTAGYWSYSERSQPLKCTYGDACPGVNPDEAVTTQTGQAGVDTQNCAEGYTGSACSSCADNYYSLNQRCYSCGSEVDQTSQMVSILTAAALVTLGLSVAVAILPATGLVRTVECFVVLQQVSEIGAKGALDLPAPADQYVATFFQYISVINFDLQILRPGCTVPEINFITLYLATLGLVALTGCLFFTACLIRWFLLERRARFRAMLNNGDTSGMSDEQRLEATKRALEMAKHEPQLAACVDGVFIITPREDFKRRVTHSFIILASVFFMKVTTMQMQIFKCAMAPAPTDALTADATTPQHLYLEADYQTRCYEGEHLAAVILTCILFICFTLGFPIGMFILLCRAFADDRTAGMIGWLRRHFSFLRSATSKGDQRKQAFHAMKSEEKKKKEEDEKHAQRGGNRNSATVAPAPDDAGDSSAPDLDREPSRPTLGRLTTVALSAPKRNIAAQLTPSQQRELANLYIMNYRMGYYGMMFWEIREEVFPYRLFSFVTAIFFAFVGVFIEKSNVQLFALGLLFALDTISIAWYLPHPEFFDNAIDAAISIAVLGQNIVLMASASGGYKSPYFVGLMVILGLALLLLIFRNKLFEKLAKWTGLSVVFVGKNNKVERRAGAQRKYEMKAKIKALEARIKALEEGGTDGSAKPTHADANDASDDDDDDDGIDWSVSGSMESNGDDDIHDDVDPSNGDADLPRDSAIRPEEVQRHLAALKVKQEADRRMQEEAEAQAALDEEALPGVNVKGETQHTLPHLISAASPTSGPSAQLSPSEETVTMIQPIKTIRPLSSSSLSGKRSSVAVQPILPASADRQSGLSTLPPSHTFPPTESIQVSNAVKVATNIAAKLLAAERSDKTESRRRTAEIESMHDKNDDHGDGDGRAESQAQIIRNELARSCNERQLLLLDTLFAQPGLVKLIEAEYFELCMRVMSLRKQILRLLEAEAEENAMAAAMPNANSSVHDEEDGDRQRQQGIEMQPLSSRRSPSSDRINAMIQYLLEKQRPDLLQTCTDYLLHSMAQYESTIDTVIHSEGRVNHSNAASYDLATQAALESRLVADRATLTQQLAAGAVSHYHEVARRCRADGSAAKQLAQTAINRSNQLLQTLTAQMAEAAAKADEAEAAGESASCPSPSALSHSDPVSTDVADAKDELDVVAATINDRSSSTPSSRRAGVHARLLSHTEASEVKKQLLGDVDAIQSPSHDHDHDHATIVAHGIGIARSSISRGNDVHSKSASTSTSATGTGTTSERRQQTPPTMGDVAMVLPQSQGQISSTPATSLAERSHVDVVDASIPEKFERKLKQYQDVPITLSPNPSSDSKGVNIESNVAQGVVAMSLMDRPSSSQEQEHPPPLSPSRTSSASRASQTQPHAAIGAGAEAAPCVAQPSDSATPTLSPHS